MGLDMFVYKMKKVDAETAKRLEGLSTDQLADFPGISVMDVRDLADPLGENGQLQHIRNLLTDVPVTEDRLDVEQIKKDHNIPEDYEYYILYREENGVRASFYGSQKDSGRPPIIDVSLTWEELDAYKVIVPGIAAVVCKKEAMYWRNRYDLADEIEAANPKEAENCVYFPVTKGMHDAILEYDGADIPYEEKDGWKYVYVEWY